MSRASEKRKILSPVTKSSISKFAIERAMVKTQLRKTREAIASGNLEASRTELSLAIKKLNRAAARGIIHQNLAARTKSRLNKAVKALANVE